MWRKLFSKKKVKSNNNNADRQTDIQTDGRTDRHKSFIDMRYYTEQYSKSN